MIGEKLRMRREQLGLSLKDVEGEIKIRSKYLEALEQEKFDQLPGKAYVKPFLKSYARFLGLDLDLTELPVVEENEVLPQKEISHQPLPDSQNKISFSFKYLLAFLGLLVVVLGIYLLTSSQNKLIKQPVQPKPSETPKVKIEHNIKKPTVFKEKTVIVEAVYGPCWLEAKEDNKIIFSGKINPPTKKQFTSSKVLTIKFGNAGAVVVTVNGITYGTPGQKGQVLKITY